MATMEGHRVHGFSDAGPALDAMDFDGVDLVITDLSMPTPGEEAVRILRGRNIRTPVLVMTGYVTEDKARYLKSIGVQKVIMKPFRLAEFLEVVRTLV